MTKEEKFKIWDATSPTADEVLLYLRCLTGETPLSLVYYDAKNKNCFRLNKFLPNRANELFGFKLPTSDKVVRFSSINRINGEIKSKYVDKKFIAKWFDRKFCNNIACWVASKNEIELLKKYQKEIEETFDILKHKGFVKTPNINWRFPTWMDDETMVCKCEDREVKLLQYLTSYGDVLVFTNWNCCQNCKK